MGAGASNSLASNVGSVLPDAFDGVQMEIVRHAKVISTLGSLSYEDFKKSIAELNELARKCIDPNGKQLVFLVKKDSDTSLLWKATVRIACIKVDPTTRKIENYKYINLKQFLCVYTTFQGHLESLSRSEQNRESQNGSNTCLNNITASILMEHVNALSRSSSGEDDNSICQHIDECSICMDRSTDLILSCAHSFCTPCIEQWQLSSKTCPICCEEIFANDMWVLSDKPGVEEINEEICAEFMSLSKVENKNEHSMN